MFAHDSSHSGTGRLWWLYSRIKRKDPVNGTYVSPLFLKPSQTRNIFRTPANPVHLKLDLAQRQPRSQVSCSLSPVWGQSGTVSPASSNCPAHPRRLHHEGEVNANVTRGVTRWCHPHRVVSPPGTPLTEITIKQVSCQPRQL